MSRRSYRLLGLLFVLWLGPVAAAAQQAEATVYTFVAEWDIAREQWPEYSAFVQRYSRPVLERMLENGIIVSWGTFTAIVHREAGLTHGTWWSASSITGIDRVLQELVKLPPNPATRGAKHHDHLLRSLIHRARTGGAGEGFLWVSAWKVQPGRDVQWREVWDRYVKPIYDDLLASGTISMYQLAAEHAHTEDPDLRYVIYLAPSVASVEQVAAAFATLSQDRAIAAALAEVNVPGTHRDLFARVLHFAQK